MTDTTTDSKPDDGKKPVFDGEFDADRAARLVANLRADLDKAKADLKTATDTLTAQADAEKSDLQKAQDRIAALEKENVSIKTEALRVRIAAKHNLPEDVHEFLVGDTEEEMEKRATALAKYAKKGETEETGETSEIPGKPKTRLVPGHTSGDDDAAFDPKAIAAAIRERG